MAFAAEKVLNPELARIVLTEPNEQLFQREPMLWDGVEAALAEYSHPSCRMAM